MPRQKSAPSRQTEFFEGLPGTGWNEHVVNLRGGALQSRQWGEVQQRLGHKPVFVQDRDWAWLAFVRSGRGIRYLYTPYGPTVRDGAALASAIESLVAAGHRLNVDFVRFEPPFSVPVKVLRSLHARPTADIQPRRTWLLDLSPDEAQLLSGVSQSNRNLINTARRRGISVVSAQQPSPDLIQEFLAMLRDTAAHNHFRPHDDTYYQCIMRPLGEQSLATLYLAYAGDQAVAGAIVFDFAGTRYYAHAAAYQHLNRRHKASVPLVWQAIIDAKIQGRRWFDFWGVAADSNPNHPWAGLSRFKRSFGGFHHEYAGTWDLPVRSVKYTAYRLVKRAIRA